MLTNGPINNSHNENGYSARLQLDYSVTADWLLYLKASTKGWAFNYNAGFAGYAPYSGLRFDGEDIYAYETGSKLEFWDSKAVGTSVPTTTTTGTTRLSTSGDKLHPV